MCTFLVPMGFKIDFYENKMNIIILCVVCLIVQNAQSSENRNPEDLIFERVERQPTNRLNRVLVCLKTDNQLTELTTLKHTQLRFMLIDSFPELNIEYHLVEDCRYQIEAKGDIIDAVIAPKPLPLSSDIPMYFFDIPYLDKQDSSEEIPEYLYDIREREVRTKVDTFPNGLFPLRDHWQSLKFALSHYLATHGWKRVAIVSDYSYYSQAFEMNLVEHLKKRGFVYKRQWCVPTASGCSFARAMRSLQRNKAFIIIVNIQGENAKSLINAAKKNQMVSNRHVWLVRDWPFGDVSSTKDIQQMVALTLSPMPGPKYGFGHDGPHLNSAWRGLGLVSNATKSINKTRLDYYYKDIYNFMYNKNKCNISKLYIHKFKSGELLDVSRTWMHNSGEVGPYEKDTVMAEKVSDLAESCLQRSHSFESPCDDTWIIVICVVWLMFIIMVVLLFYFFNRCLVWT